MADRFIFDSYSFDASQKIATFTYRLLHEGTEVSFSEVLVFPEREMRIIPDNLLSATLKTVHLMLGISYYRLYCPHEIVINSYALSHDEAEFWNIVYSKGLGELFYKNNIDFEGLVQFPQHSIVKKAVSDVRFQSRSLVGIGGGKDSLVSLELLKKSGNIFDGIVVETHKRYPLIHSIVEKHAIPTLFVERRVDPKLRDLITNKKAYSGHIPVSAIYACIGVLTAVLFDYDAIITSNERSADFGNIKYRGHMINHQWSKSSEFEIMMNEYIHTMITPNIDYFSLLRPFSELKISQMFSQIPQFFAEFSSCNRNFSVNNSIGNRWCGECPKCIFVFIILSAFLNQQQLQSIFDSNYFDREEIIPHLQTLLGIRGHKPFECVGTPDEVKAALYLAHCSKSFEETVVMSYFQKHVLPEMNYPKGFVDRCMKSENFAMIPKKFLSVVGNL